MGKGVKDKFIKHRRLWQGIALSLLLSSCVSIPTPQERSQLADQLAKEKTWIAQNVVAAPFVLRTYVPSHIDPADHLTIYIEGDGLAWISSDQASSDPTPRRPLALQLALAQPQGNAAYLGRPCQYIDAQASACAKQYWTQARFAPEVIQPSHLAIDQLKQRFGARHISLVGYSGGASVALLVAAGRQDISDVITVAGNLDHQAWTSYHHITPLSASLNPAHQIAALAKIRQVHFSGEKDRVIPPVLTNNFAHLFPQNSHVRVITVPDFDHQCCWAQNWPQYWQQYWQLAQSVANP